MNKGTVTAVNVSAGGVPKLCVGHAAISDAGVAGDQQRDRKHHGGPDRAVCLYSLELIQALRREGHPITPGSAGENLTLLGLQWDSIVPGAQLQVGSATLEVTSYTAPCKFIRDSFADGKFERISQKTNPGWSRVYARVLVQGEVSVGDSVVVADT